MSKNIKTKGSDVLKYYSTFDPLPQEANLATANSKLLKKHGLPRKPNKEKEPVLFKHWKRLHDKKPDYIKAELKIDEVLSKRDPLRRAGSEFRPISWGGIGVETEDLGWPLGQQLFVFGEWVVPAIYPVQGQSGLPQTVGFWVGIDGWSGTQVLQAGIAATVTGDSVDYWVWTEWYTEEYMDPAVKVSNFSIRQGDLISFLICAQELDYGLITILNSTTNQMTSIGVQGRPGTGMYLDGTSVEWIVEGISEDLPDFYSWTFSQAFAGSRQGPGLISLRPNGLTREIIGTGGYYLTESLIASENTAVVLWKGLS